MYAVNWDLLKKLELKRDAFSGKTVLITGGARGIGEATAVTIAALGGKVVIIDQLPQGQAVADTINKSGGKAQFLLCDISIADDLLAALPKAVEAFGQIDILINNALHMDVSPVTQLTLEEWELTYGTNARSAFLNIKHLLPGMQERKDGVIVNVIAYEGTAMATAYAGTKMALRSMALSVAREIGPEAGVAVYSYVPGIVDTPLLREHAFPKMMAMFDLSEEQVIEIVAQNPGFEGLMPVDYCATALVYTIAHAPEYHGQVADPFEPLDRVGAIEIPAVDPEKDAAQLDISGPLSGLYLKQYLGEVTSLNRELEQRIEVRTRELEAARKRSEDLLLNILPSPIAERLKGGENMIADHFNEATVLFADIVGFTPMTAGLAPDRVVEMLDMIFSEFDKISGYFELEKIKTIGDCYMAVGGLPQPQADHASLVASAALQMVPALENISAELKIPLSTRIGLHTGSVVAGVIGQQKFIYDLWGDTVNTASRMESHGIGNRIQCTQEVYDMLNDKFAFEPRGEIEIKGKGPMSTYFLLGSK